MVEADDTHYVSPDGLLTVIVRRYPDDVVLGFAGMPWHTHGDTLAELSGYSIDEAVSRFLKDLQQGHLVIAIASVNGVVRDIYIKDNPEQWDRFKPDDEVILLRYWDGTLYTPGSSNHRWHL
jgi:hypothetical protein